MMVAMAFLLPRGAALAQPDLGGVWSTIAAWSSDYELDLTSLRTPTPEEWQQFWGVVNTALASESLEDLAVLVPYAQMALGYLDRYPEARPYADWLRQRMDYFTMADEVIKEQRAMPAPRTPSPPPPVKKPGMPPPSAPVSRPPVATPPPPDATATASAKSADVDRWIRKLEGRPPPSRAATYVPQLKPVFRKQGVPEQLVWLAEVESSFDPAARSPVGALGLYQFMPATAERFGLALKPSDERLVPERSAYAAATYLKFLHGRFNSWPLALAAYNAGEGRVGRLLKKHQAGSFEEIAAYLPSETRMYVPKIDAVVRLREGKTLGSL